jgi:hypothetical protein
VIDPHYAALFWRKVHRTPGCWPWGAARFASKYGMFSTGWGPYRRTYRAHRFVWELIHGRIPDGMCVLHRCDNPPCVRPDHLFLGTNQDHTDDMLAKGRHRTVSPPRLGDEVPCPRGHVGHFYRYANGRTCKVCKGVTPRA